MAISVMVREVSDDDLATQDGAREDRALPVSDLPADGSGLFSPSGVLGGRAYGGVELYRSGAMDAGSLEVQATIGRAVIAVGDCQSIPVAALNSRRYRIYGGRRGRQRPVGASGEHDLRDVMYACDGRVEPAIVKCWLDRYRHARAHSGFLLRRGRRRQEGERALIAYPSQEHWTLGGGLQPAAFTLVDEEDICRN